MKDRAIEITNDANGEREKTNVLREYLQHVLLRNLFEQDLLPKLAFHGGTALRILYELPRFSEDLDFHLRTPNDELDLQDLRQRFAERLMQQGYDVSFKIRTERTVQFAFVKFGELLYETGLTDHEDENLRIKIEVDTNPPESFRCEPDQVNRFFPFVVHHHDLPTFLAGKLHAVFQREYTKGRDLFDLNFYLTRWEEVPPNVTYLNNALRQTGYEGKEITKENWRRETTRQVKEMDWEKVRQDLKPFILRPDDLKVFRKDLLINELEEE